MSSRNDRTSLIAVQDGGTPLKSSRGYSPAVVVPHHYPPTLDASSHYGVPPSSYEAVIRNLPYKQVSGDQRLDYQQDARYRDAEYSQQQQQQQRSHALGPNGGADRDPTRPPFSSASHAHGRFHQQTVPYTTSSRPPTTMDVVSTLKRPRLMSDFIQPLRVDVDARRDMSGSSAYKPQVEAISPTLPADDALGSQIRHSRDELIQNIHRVDRDIAGVEQHIEKLKRKQQQLEEEAKKPAEEKSATPELVIDMKNQSIAQTIHTDNHRKAVLSHTQLEKLGKATLLPLYAQPSDTDIYHENKTKFATFKKSLILFLKRRHKATKIRENYWAEKYEKLLHSWAKRLEKVENNLKRRVKDAKKKKVPTATLR